MLRLPQPRFSAVEPKSSCRQKQQPQSSRFTGPPAEWHASEDCAQALAAEHPALQRLVDDGLLLAIPRSPGYTKRREDGYEEPLCVVLLGTAHLSRRSPADVREVLAALRPDAVAVELCRSRSGLLSSEGGSFSLSSSAGEGFAAALARTLRLGGGLALILRALLERVSRAAASATEDAPLVGAEFVAAREAAAEIGATVLLGDRPVELTLRRALELTSWQEKLSLLSLLLRLTMSVPSERHPSAADADSLLARPPALQSMLSDALSQFPGLASAVLHERDAYLAWSACRSKAVSGKRLVVAVVGAAHLRGVAWALQSENRAVLRFEALRGERPKQQPLWARLLIDAVLGGAVWLGWEAWTGGDALHLVFNQ
jgi:pheromone shutdown protein TraB